MRLLKKNSEITMEWTDFYHNFSAQKVDEIIEKLSKKYDLPKNKINIVKRYVQKSINSNDDSNASNAILDTILDPKQLQKTYLNFLDSQYGDLDKDTFFAIDELVLDKMPDMDTFDTKNRKYNFIYIKGENIFSFSDFEVVFENQKGINLIHSMPENQGGKSALSRMTPFLLFGNSIKYVDKTITYAQIFNKFAIKNTAFVEGEIEVNNEIYYIKRTLARKKSNVTHSLDFYRYDEDGEDVGLRLPAVNLSIKNAVETQKIIESLIGTYKDYVFANYYEYHNIEQWIQTTPKQIYRLFCEYLGLALLEAKYQVANDMLNQHQKSSLISKYNITDLEASNLILVEELKELTEKRIELDKELLDCDINLVSESAKIKQLYDKKHPVDTKYESFDKVAITSEISTLNDRINKAKILITELESEISNYNGFEDSSGEKARMELEISTCQEEIKNIKTPIAFTDELEWLIKEADGITISAEQIDKQASIQNDINNLKIKLSTCKSEIDVLEDLIEKTPLETTCSKCGNIEDKTQNILDIKNTIDSKIKEMLNISNDILPTTLKLLEIAKRDNDNILRDLNKTASNKILNQKDKIEVWRNNQKDLINNEITSYKAKLDELKDFEIKKGKLKNFIEAKETIIEKKLLREEECKEYENNIIKIQENLEISSEIDIVVSNQKYLTKIYEACRKDISNLIADEAVKRLKISDNKELIDTLREDYSYETALKLYRQIHSDDGLSKHIMLTILPQINADLAILLEGICDFELSIQFDDKKIEFILTKDGVEQQLYEGSGLEKTLSCLALHYVNCKMTTLPISNNLVLDEILGRVAPSNFESVMKIIKKLCEVFETVYLITHTHGELLRELVDNEILIEKKGNISQIA